MQKDNISTFVAMCSVFLVRQVTFKITTYPPTKPINTKLVWDSGSFIERIHVVFYRLRHMGHMICPYDMGHIKWAFLYGGVFCVKSHYNSKVGNMVDTYKMCLNFAETGELEYISKGQIFFKINFRRERIFVWRRYYSTNVHKVGTALSSMDWRIGPIVSSHTSERKLVKILPMHITSINIDTDINVN